MSEEELALVDKINHVLKVYPVISPTMLQIGVGTHVSAGTWRPVLEQLIKQGKLFRQEWSGETPAGINRVHTRLSLHPLEDPIS